MNDVMPKCSCFVLLGCVDFFKTKFQKYATDLHILKIQNAFCGILQEDEGLKKAALPRERDESRRNQ